MVETDTMNHVSGTQEQQVATNSSSIIANEGSLSEILGDTILEKYFGKDKKLFDQITQDRKEEIKENVQENIVPKFQEKLNILNEFLLAVGYPKKFVLRTESYEGALDSALRLIYELIQQHRKQQESQEEWIENHRRLDAQKNNCQQMISRLEKKLEEKERQLCSLEAEYKKKIKDLERDRKRWMEECTEWKIKTANWEQLQIQYDYEMRKKDNEYQRLQHRLREIMQQRSNSVARRNVIKKEPYEEHKKEIRMPCYEMDQDQLQQEEMYQLIRSSFEERIEMLQKENDAIRSCIYTLNLELDEILNGLELNDEDSNATLSRIETFLRWKLELPFEVAGQGVQACLLNKLKNISILFKKVSFPSGAKERDTLSPKQLHYPTTAEASNSQSNSHQELQINEDKQQVFDSETNKTFIEPSTMNADLEDLLINSCQGNIADVDLRVPEDNNSQSDQVATFKASEQVDAFQNEENIAGSMEDSDVNNKQEMLSEDEENLDEYL